MNYRTSDSFIMYRTTYNIYKKLSKQSPQLAKDFIETICNYAFDGVLPDEDDPIMLYAELPIKQIQRSLRHYQQKLIEAEEERNY